MNQIVHLALEMEHPGVVPVKFRAPGGTVMELVTKGRYNTSADE